jgi:hypothetical protein
MFAGRETALAAEAPPPSAETRYGISFELLYILPYASPTVYSILLKRQSMHMNNRTVL